MDPVKSEFSSYRVFQQRNHDFLGGGRHTCIPNIPWTFSPWWMQTCHDFSHYVFLSCTLQYVWRDDRPLRRLQSGDDRRCVHGRIGAPGTQRDPPRGWDRAYESRSIKMHCSVCHSAHARRKSKTTYWNSFRWVTILLCQTRSIFNT